MHQPLQSIIQHLFQVNSLEDVSRQRLESFVEEYPSFGIGHYLLSHKLRTEDPDRFRETTQRTGLYFSNPLWLQWLMENGAPRNVSAVETIELPVIGSPAASVGEPAAEAPPQPIGESVVQPAASGEPAAEASAQPIEEPAMPSPAEPIEEPVAAVPAAPLEEPTADGRQETIEEPTTDGHQETIEEPSGGENGSAADQLLLRVREAKDLRESLQKINDDFGADPFRQDEPIHDEETAYVLDESEEAPAPGISTPPPPAEVPEPAPPAQDLVFEPYHTIDYFASQGIRLKLEENPGDALGKQLKSFTDWLKVMRRLPQKERESSVPDRAAEQAVQTFAAHSIQSKDVVTETMAEVLIKQGMRDRARLIYEKLSLLNPDKKAYFATKIEQLNIP